MSNFILNPYYKERESEIINALTIVNRLLDQFYNNTKSFEESTELIGEGNDAGGKVYSINGTEYCLKISKLSKYVGKNQEKQFELALECMKAIKDKSVTIEGDKYALKTEPPVAVMVDEINAYTLMYRLDNTVRLWDEAISFKDKDNWVVIRKVKKIMREFGGEDFVVAMDINGNNMLVDQDKKVIYLIDPYVS